jgi:hypothetical protein
MGSAGRSPNPSPSAYRIESVAVYRCTIDGKRKAFKFSKFMVLEKARK